MSDDDLRERLERIEYKINYLVDCLLIPRGSHAQLDQEFAETKKPDGDTDKAV